MMIKKKLLIGVMSLFTLTACGGSADTWAFNFQSSDNLLKDATFTPSYWIADDGWNTLIENFEGFEGTSGEFVFTAPEGLGHSQWQGQR